MPQFIPHKAVKHAFAILILGSLPLVLAGQDCLLCHDDPELTLERDGKLVSLAVSETAFEGTPHEGFDCTDCHSGLDENAFPHADSIPPAVASCLDCHDDLSGSHAFHPGFDELSKETVLTEALNCTGCHGSHRIFASEAEKYPFSPTRQTSRCGTCHELESIGYLHSAHARALEEGAESAPTCLSCHESHQAISAKLDGNGQRKILLSELCMSCHVEDPEVAGKTLYGTPFMTSFNSSVHGKAAP